ncbi:MAG: hypothetical protein PHI06_08095 [Desulfobulbaceae bacterium]|nr:hypothetical protein [Desulfobulbaceae bacterium]
MGVKNRGRLWRSWWLSSLVLWAAASLWHCERPDAASPLILNDFEGQEDLQLIAWRCRTTFSLSERYRSHGHSGLLMTLYPDAYPGLRLLLTPGLRHWQGYRYLALDVINSGSESLLLHYRIDDQKDAEYGDRVNGSFHLEPGENHLRLNLEQIRTSGGKRPLKLDHIEAVMFFQTSPPKPLALGVDYIRLEREGASL